MIRAAGVEVKELLIGDIDIMAAAFERAGWSKSASLLERYLTQQQSGALDVLVAWRNEVYADPVFAGYLTVIWDSEYRPFRDARVPEISDINVVPWLQRKGVGTQLMQAAEARIAELSSVAGIGVGMSADYGPAQRLYVLRGYAPDGRGLMSHQRPVKFASQVPVDHELTLYLTKQVR